MKKDQKFLLKLEDELMSVSKKKRDTIVKKYRDLIDEGKSLNKRIVDILKELGSVEEIAIKEKEIIKQNKWYLRIFKKKENQEIINKEIDYQEEEAKDLKEEIKEEKEELKKERIKKEEKNQIKKKKKTKKKSKSKKTKIKRTIKYKISVFFDSVKKVFKKKTKAEKIVEEVKDNTENVIENVTESVTKVIPFETKRQKIFRILISILEIIFLVVVVFLLLWVTVVFIASMFAYLDGLKIYGVILALFALVLLMLWFVILFNNLINRKKLKGKFMIISVVIIVMMIGIGISYTIKQYYGIEKIEDVSEKYSMTTSYETYKIPSNNRKLYISFNSNYKTKYIIENDDKLDGIVKVEVKYYECYYDFFAKQTSNNLYISLKLDPRDRMSVYIDDLKDNKIFDTDELSRYTVRIIMNEKDKDRVVID